ncbi:hypothetical protein DYB28_003938 [Aphanomyces astaci]|uniref:Uncharacterized protein n=1 Tax=Aphanomyces astaci TaxID=112090 RepID=A0A9X8E4H9_APHAT|nr:hypothetical protein DYB28_003938 [Aphanomyces astaci]
MSDVFRYVNWLRTFAANHQLYVGPDDEPKPSPAAKLVEALEGRYQGAGQPQRQKTERGVLLENIVRVDDVLLDAKPL